MYCFLCNIGASLCSDCALPATGPDWGWVHFYRISGHFIHAMLHFESRTRHLHVYSHWSCSSKLCPENNATMTFILAVDAPDFFYTGTDYLCTEKQILFPFFTISFHPHPLLLFFFFFSLNCFCTAVKNNMLVMLLETH